MLSKTILLRQCHKKNVVVQNPTKKEGVSYGLACWCYFASHCTQLARLTKLLTYWKFSVLE